MILIRYFLIGLIVFLLVRSFMRLGQENEPERPLKNPGDDRKHEKRKIAKNVGEYVDYEELKKDD